MKQDNTFGSMVIGWKIGESLAPLMGFAILLFGAAVVWHVWLQPIVERVNHFAESVWPLWIVLAAAPWAWLIASVRHQFFGARRPPTDTPLPEDPVFGSTRPTWLTWLIARPLKYSLWSAILLSALAGQYLPGQGPAKQANVPTAPHSATVLPATAGQQATH